MKRAVRRIPDVQYQNGDVVVATITGRGWRARGYSQVTFREGDELVVTSVRRDQLSVRKGAYGYVFRVDSAWVRPREGGFRLLGEAPEGMISADDPRLDWLWRDAARVADIEGHCAEYDALCDMLGIPGRERSFSVRVEVAPGVELRGRVVARSEAEARRVLAGQVAAQMSRGPLAIEGGAL